MTTTPTAALVEEAEKITEGVPADWTACPCNKCGLVWALGEMHIATVELETGESDCAQPSPEQRRRIMDFMARSRSMIPELAAALRRAEAEREEARAQVWGLICAGSNMAKAKRYFQGLWETLLDAGLKTDSKLSELTATRDLLNEENARLQERVATLELLRRGGK